MDRPSKKFGISKLIYYFFLKKSFKFLFRFDENIEDGDYVERSQKSLNVDKKISVKKWRIVVLKKWTSFKNSPLHQASHSIWANMTDFDFSSVVYTQHHCYVSNIKKTSQYLAWIDPTFFGHGLIT